MRCLLNQELKPVLIDRRQFAVRLGNRRRAPGPGVNERHLSQKIIHPDRFHDFVVNDDSHFAFEHHIHLVPGFAFLENDITRFVGDIELGIPEEMTQLHSTDYDRAHEKIQAGFS